MSVTLLLRDGTFSENASRPFYSVVDARNQMMNIFRGYTRSRVLTSGEASPDYKVAATALGLEQFGFSHEVAELAAAA